MSRFGIWLDGERYHYQEYTYDKVTDAIDYARLQESRKKA